MFSEWLVQNRYVESADTIEDDISIWRYNELYVKYCELTKS